MLVIVRKIASGLRYKQTKLLRKPYLTLVKHDRMGFDIENRRETLTVKCKHVGGRGVFGHYKKALLHSL